MTEGKNTEGKNLTYGVPTPADFAARTGRQLLQAIIDGELPHPPISKTLSFWITAVGDGSAVFEGEPATHLLNPMGGVHGGWALTLIDSAAGCSGLSLLPPGYGFATIETKGNLSRAITKDTGRVRAEGHVIAHGRTIVSAEATVFSQDGKVLAHGTSTLMILSNDRR